MANETAPSISLEAQPVLDSSYRQGVDFTFTQEEGNLEDPANHHKYRGLLRVGGLEKETEDVEGVRVEYVVLQVYPQIGERTGIKQGEFVVQTFTRDKLERKAQRAIEILQDELSPVPWWQRDTQSSRTA